MTEILAASRADEWRRLDPSRTVLMDLDRGQVVLELAPTFAPELLRNLRTLVRGGWFDGLSINRVQDNFVTQWGDAEGDRPLGAAAVRVTPEFERDCSRRRSVSSTAFRSQAIVRQDASGWRIATARSV
jgi:peptidylprolyl isomerase